MSDLVMRRRVPSDLDPLAEVLFAQQPRSRYPFRDPLPIPVRDFLHADDAGGAWTAALDGHPVGHGSWTAPSGGSADADAVNAACAEAYGCEVAQLAWVGALFVGEQARGLGAGRHLLDAAVTDIRAHGLHPCLEVLAVHPAAHTLYVASGWHEVMTFRPAWLRAAAGDEAPDVRVMVLPDRDPET
ncbi:MAG: GNAT family N-acetyltransferase [Nocardioides sp.]|uniref:GNAT family N-acetyltransferase n=1 Tax=Nocardioides sp. TaxID=35761 RepID=UPI003F0039D8